jgi:hypothetical protein
VTVPEQVELQVHPYSAEHADCVVFELQGVIVPPHVPGFQLQPYWYVHSAEDVMEAHGVSVPVQAVDQVQPALLHRLDEA